MDGISDVLLCSPHEEDTSTFGYQLTTNSGVGLGTAESTVSLSAFSAFFGPLLQGTGNFLKAYSFLVRGELRARLPLVNSCEGFLQHRLYCLS